MLWDPWMEYLLVVSVVFTGIIHVRVVVLFGRV
jgi:hypothetical protein